MTYEFDMRLNDIRSGPWHVQSQLARRLLPRFDADTVSRYLRPHYEDRLGVTELPEIKFRESFDQLLEELQLLELATASGYLPLDVVRPVAVPVFETFVLPYPAARSYLVAYDFMLVRFMAARLGLDLDLDSVTPPPIDSRATVRFASFLAVHTEFTSNPAVERFTMLLDDYRFADLINASFLKEHAAAEPDGLTPKQRAAFGGAVQGLVQFVQILGDFFMQIGDDQRPLFGCAYAYWLGHFFGQRRRSVGYVDLGVSFGGLTFGPQFVHEGLDPRAVEVEFMRLNRRIDTLREVWSGTRELIESLSVRTRSEG